MLPFIYIRESAAKDWPIYKREFELFLDIKEVPIAVITPDQNAVPPVIGETTMKAKTYLLHFGGSHIRDIHYSLNNHAALNYVTFTDILTAQFVPVPNLLHLGLLSLHFLC